MGLEIRSFRATHYNPEHFGWDFSPLSCPPYDVIDEKHRQQLLSSSPYNYVNVILPKPLSEALAEKQSKDYQKVRELINQWKEQGVFVKEDEEKVYLYKQIYRINDQQKIRYGFIALLRLPEDSDSVLPHERTHRGPKEDRFELLSEVQAILEPVFFLIEDEGKSLLEHIKSGWEQRGEVFFAKSLEEEHFCFGTSDRKWIEKLFQLVSEKRALIADGHHRYEVALQYRDFKKSQADYDPQAWYNYIMVYFAPMNEENITVLPIHRKVKEFSVRGEDGLVKRIKKLFDAYVCDDSVLKEISLGNADSYTYGLVTKFGKFEIKLKSELDPAQILTDEKQYSLDYKRLDVVVLHKILFPLLDIREREDNLEYEKSLESAIQLDTAMAGFILRPTPLNCIYKMALNGERMPQKSTYFYPKIRSGFVFFDSL